LWVWGFFGVSGEGGSDQWEHESERQNLPDRPFQGIRKKEGRRNLKGEEREKVMQRKKGYVK